MSEREAKNTYTQREVINVLIDMKDEIAALRNDLTETQTLIRDYNNLRATINEVKRDLVQFQARSDTQERDKKDTGASLYNKALLVLYIGMFLISLYSTFHK